MLSLSSLTHLFAPPPAQSVEQSARIDTVSTICSVIFSAEVLFHISAKGPTLYFDDYLNIFDFVIASLALVSAALQPESRFARFLLCVIGSSIRVCLM